MCIIVDASCLHHIANFTECGRPIMRWLLNPQKLAGLIVGGKLYDELRRSSFERTRKEEFYRTLKVLSEAGRLHNFRGGEVDQKTEEIRSGGIRSNDPHVIALAIISKCNVVFTEDKDLARDLKDRAVVTHKVSIYKNQNHTRLLTTCRCTSS
jgi:rRNA-processing protein FCF1